MARALSGALVALTIAAVALGVAGCGDDAAVSWDTEPPDAPLAERPERVASCLEDESFAVERAARGSEGNSLSGDVITATTPDGANTGIVVFAIDEAAATRAEDRYSAQGYTVEARMGDVAVVWRDYPARNHMILLDGCVGR